MGEYPRRKCDCEYERSMLAAMDVDGRTKIRATEEEDAISSSSKRRKVDDSDKLSCANLVENSASASTKDSTISSSSSSLFTEELSDMKQENMRSADLKHKDSATEIGTVNICQFSRETSPATSDLSAEFMKSSSSATSKKKFSLMNSQRTRPTAAEMPSSAEIEEFFSAAEKREEKRFAEKYNYDIVKDVPLEGRYNWTRFKP